MLTIVLLLDTQFLWFFSNCEQHRLFLATFQINFSLYPSSCCCSPLNTLQLLLLQFNWTNCCRLRSNASPSYIELKSLFILQFLKCSGTYLSNGFHQWHISDRSFQPEREWHVLCSYLVFSPTRPLSGHNSRARTRILHYAPLLQQVHTETLIKNCPWIDVSELYVSFKV